MYAELIKSIIEKLKQQGKMKFPVKAAEDAINQFEKESQFHLPSQYRDWLQCVDGGEFFLPAGIQLYGVAHQPIIDPEDPDRPDNSYVVIGSLAAGDPILCKKNSEEIAIYNHEAGKIEPDEIYPNFLSFLNDLTNILGIGGEADVQSDGTSE